MLSFSATIYIFAMTNNFTPRKFLFYKSYFQDFLTIQTEQVKKKILWTLKLIESEPKIHTDYFKHLKNTDGIYEIRIQLGNNHYRIFCFFQENNCIVIGNCFQKKPQKTPKKEILKASKIKKEYEIELKNSR